MRIVICNLDYFQGQISTMRDPYQGPEQRVRLDGLRGGNEPSAELQRPIVRRQHSVRTQRQSSICHH